MELPIPFYALVLDEEKRKSKTGKCFWQNTLKTPHGTFRSFIWNASDDAEKNPAFPHEGDIIEVVGYDNQIAERGNVVINTSGFMRITWNEIPEEYKGSLEFNKASKEEMDYAMSIIYDSSFWENKIHFDFMMQCLNSIDQRKLIACPAATHVHHSFQGGLLVHTAEVLELCRSIAETSSRRYDFINKDVLYTSAILHDIGKIETYYVSDLGVSKQITSEKTIGHIFYGMSLVKSNAELFNNSNENKLDDDFVHEVMHCIASHHGQPEFGSIKPCLSVEAGILSRVDYLSSRNGMVESALRDAIATDTPMKDTFTIYGDAYFCSAAMKSYLENHSKNN